MHVNQCDISENMLNMSKRNKLVLFVTLRTDGATNLLMIEIDLNFVSTLVFVLSQLKNVCQ